MPAPVKANVQGIVEIRNQAAHLGVLKPEVQERILRFGTAGVLNFIKLSSNWLGATIDAPYLLPVGLVGHAKSAKASFPRGQRELIRTLVGLTRLPSGTDDPEYPVVIDVQIEVRPGLSGGGSVGMTTDPKAPKFRVSDDEALRAFPATYDDLITKCKKRHSDFKQNAGFYKLLRSLKADPHCAHERKLNPKIRGSTTQMFYNLDTTLAKLDEEYTKHS